MTSLFASPDIAALIVAFPPHSPTRTLPSLVHSHSGNGLLNSTTVLNRFRTLLATEPHRIKRSDVPQRLGVERIDWLLDSYDDKPPIRWDRFQKSLIPDPVWQAVLQSLSSRCQKTLVEIDPFVKEHDIQDLGWRDLEPIISSQNLRSFGSGSMKDFKDDIYLAGPKVLDEMKAEIESAFHDASTEKINLSQLLPSRANTVILAMAHELKSQEEVEMDDNQVFFVPSGYYAAHRERLQADHEAHFQALLEKFENDDFVQIPIENTAELCERYTTLHANVDEPRIIRFVNNDSVVVLPSRFDRMVVEIKNHVATIVSESTDYSKISLEEDETIALLASMSSEPDLANAILKDHGEDKQISSAIAEAIAVREQAQLDQFGISFRRQVFTLGLLYGDGIASVADQKLKQSLDDYVCSHFRDEIIPTFANSAREQGLLGNDKKKKLDFDKFIERCGRAKEFGVISTAMRHLTKKLNCGFPVDDDKEAVRSEILQRKALKEMPKMMRGSDLLQNLVWILLSVATEKSDDPNLKITSADDTSVSLPEQPGPTPCRGATLALFMSPGKDTGRMIKQYATIAPGDNETAKRLSDWRDKLKTGSERKEDLDAMKLHAKEAVQGFGV